MRVSRALARFFRMKNVKKTTLVLMQSGAVAATQLRIMITPTKNNKDYGFARCFTKNKCYPVKVILHLWQLAKAKVVFKEKTIKKTNRLLLNHRYCAGLFG